MVAEIGHFPRMPQDRVTARAGPSVTILMATRDGARYLPAQLASIARQTCRDWQLWVSDDGSTDATPDIVARFAQSHPLRIMAGPGRGAAANFLSLLMHPDLPPGPVAFADQDDVWRQDKLARALARLASLPVETPALYAADSVIVDGGLRPLARTLARGARPSFGNALVQNICSGHTMVLNAAAVALARQVATSPTIRHHDWWLYQLVTGAGGHVCLDRDPVALYRQHAGNVMGRSSALSRLAPLLRGEWGAAMRDQAMALRCADVVLSPAARSLRDAYLGGFAPAGRARVGAFMHHGMARSTRAQTLALQICAFFGRV